MANSFGSILEKVIYILINYENKIHHKQMGFSKYELLNLRQIILTCWFTKRFFDKLQSNIAKSNTHAAQGLTNIPFSVFWVFLKLQCLQFSVTKTQF